MSDTPTPRPRHSAGAQGRPSAASARRSRSSASSAPEGRTPRFTRETPAAGTPRSASQNAQSPSGATGVSRPTPVRPANATGVHVRGYVPESHSPEPESRVPRGAAVAIALAAVAVLVGVLVFVLTRFVFAPQEEAMPSVEPGQTVTVVIPEGAGGDVIASELLSAGVISDEKAFMQAVSSQGADMKLRPGTYQLLTGMDPNNVVAQLVAGPNTQEGRLTVPEGLTVAKTADVVEKALGIPTDDFLAQAKASNYVADYPFLDQAADDSLEGYLWAKTYEFSGKEVSADSVIRAMLNQYAAEVPTIDFTGGEQEINATYGFDPTNYDILKMASIIQREAAGDEDLSLISSVFWNRIRQGMALQSDATMGYVTGGDVTADDLKTDSPYNTYLYQGLPPTPICTPDLACIQAALHPEPSDYLYFLIIEDDGYSNHTFSRTYEEHLQAIENARQEMSELGL